MHLIYHSTPLPSPYLLTSIVFGVTEFILYHQVEKDKKLTLDNLQTVANDLSEKLKLMKPEERMLLLNWEIDDTILEKASQSHQHSFQETLRV